MSRIVVSNLGRCDLDDADLSRKMHRYFQNIRALDLSIDQIRHSCWETMSEHSKVISEINTVMAWYTIS